MDPSHQPAIHGPPDDSPSHESLPDDTPSHELPQEATEALSLLEKLAQLTGQPLSPDLILPPPEYGVPMAVVARGLHHELRITRYEHAEQRYLTVRLWRRDADHRWWPCGGRGLCLLEDECAMLLAVLQDFSVA